ncbi:hypothetical protein WJ0W_005481 [Paenibacillus melissococcoides]|uniref:Uncharacterized protein n=1 Tax=Paenibacillus melissococcoides TaxID=2912268 RepID=A0ABM9G8A5_9BACL|nr:MULTISPECIES: hypothetical protein [Paenibacillus]MEB9896436.1 hypothetical protein [Bacillus cereus]CAH8248223.1 hypothetical protein WJ0W_005481 [Paenibacillus melissococcoides]CAH8718119.1 hypothetical protein HTL2_005168 [Paenibacillus melissococcoides]CAH8719003.1 hypothetical protein WDD9_005405 [Paenibacillus melissococcoides]
MKSKMNLTCRAADARDKASSISAQLCYRNGDWMIRKTNHFYLNVLEKALACSKAVRDKKGIRFYKKMLKKEQKSIDKMFKNG